METRDDPSDTLRYALSFKALCRTPPETFALVLRTKNERRSLHTEEMVGLKVNHRPAVVHILG